MMELLEIAREKTLSGKGLSPREALELTSGCADERATDALFALTDEIRRKYKGVEVNLCGIVNAKSGLCGEDCSFCSQSQHYDTDATEYPMLAADEIVKAAREAEKNGAREFSIVTSGTKLAKKYDLKNLAKALEEMRSSASVERCASLGILDESSLKELKSAGLESYHHNLETARSYFPKVCTTHGYDEDVETVKRAKVAGFYVCSGGLFGLGESWEQRAELVETLASLEVDCVPINFLNPRPGTPLEGASNLTPMECLRIIAMTRLMLPTKDIIVCGGREVNLGDSQHRIFEAGANGMMVGNYLTTKGRSPDKDLKMLKELGLTPRPGHDTLKGR